ncbi:MAG: rhodanese-like domain-containing protein [Myxococcales bacterium]|nr:rhodanese-like domain-containing protein [Myxococcales bacterium]MCB9648021.1 rhodanese-like domain-containing protein [Deltaproteobacteria bacterium]
MTSTIMSISAGDLADAVHGPQAPLVLDVRRPEDFSGEGGHIDGASLFPAERFRERLPELRGLEPRRFVVVSEDGDGALEAARIMMAAGFVQVSVLAGGMRAWRAEQLPVHR